MNLSQLAGATSGLIAAGLALIGLVILLLVSGRLAFVIRRPHKGRIAKGLAAGALVLLVCGALLFLASDLTDGYPSFRHLLDGIALWIAGLTIFLATCVGVRAGRRRRTEPAVEPSTPGTAEAATPAETSGTPPGAAQG